MIRRQQLAVLAVAAVLVSSAAPFAHAQALSRKPEVEEAYNRGVELIGQGQYKEAVEELNNALALDSTYPEAYIAKGDALLAMEDYQAAGKAYTDALNIDANAAQAYNGRGECYMEGSSPDYNLALNDFQNALAIDRNNPKALSNMGHVLVNYVSNPAEALRFLDDAIEINPQDARAFRDRGLANALLRDYKKSVVDLQQAIQVDPSDYENYYSLAQVYQLQDQYADMADALGKAIETYKPKKRTDSETFLMGYIVRADARLRMSAEETDPAARTAALEGAVADANAVLAEYEDRYPESGRALYRRGRAERLLEKYSDAVDSLTKAIQNIPGGQDAEYMSDAYLYRGICFYYIGSLDLARGDFEQASATGGGFQDPRIFLWIGFTYHQQGDFRQAIDSYNQAIAKAPNFALAHINKGRAYMDLSEYARAIESFNNAIRTEPGVGNHYYNVGLAYIKQQEFTKAVDFLRIALKKENPQPKVFLAMATALRGLGRNELADEYERQGRAAAPAPQSQGAGSGSQTGMLQSPARPTAEPARS